MNEIFVTIVQLLYRLRACKRLWIIIQTKSK